MQKMQVICHSCGKKKELVAGTPPCKMLSGWLTISWWKGLESVDRYNFCSFVCLQRWVDSQVPKIPEVFLKSFEEKR